MKKFLVPVFATLTTASAGAATVDQQRGHYRLLLIFAPDETSAGLRLQRAGDIEAAGAFRERALLRVEIIGDSVSGASDTARSLRKRYRVPATAFRAVLVGKDGGAKLETAKPLIASRIVSTIDAMPMRQDETRRARPSSE